LSPPLPAKNWKIFHRVRPYVFDQFFQNQKNL
jgi:hypothetical protein